MKTLINEVQAVYNNTIRQQDITKITSVAIAKDDCTQMLERAKQDIEKIAQAAGVEVLKTACIAVRRGMRQQQEIGLNQLNEMLQKIRETGSKVEAIKWGMVAAGYANGMYCGDLMSKSELQDVIQVIDQAYKNAELRIESAKRPSWLHTLRKWVNA